VRAIVVDIEGTTSSLAFVKDQLFAFARRHLPGYVREHEAQLADLLDETRALAGDRQLDGSQLIQVLLRWMDEDRKLTPLKALQGRVWQQGFDSGELRAHVYEDAVRALQAWRRCGYRLYVYSSGSVAAQQLLFAHTTHGDLTPLFSGYFDTTSGSKLETTSYRAIAAALALPANTILFLSDHPAEISAALDAGWQAILVSRPQETALAPRSGGIASFEEISLPELNPLLNVESQSRRAPPGAPAGYAALTPQTVPQYLAGQEAIAARLGGQSTQWRTREVGDGNLNLVFIVEGPGGAVVVKQALPYVRLVGESWPLPLSRSHFEHLALREEARWAEAFVPAVYQADATMALIVMQYLTPHIVLRKGLIRGIRYPQVGQHLGMFLARTLFHTSDLHLTATAKRSRIADFLGNTALCRISEDLIFDEPYFAAPLNRHTSPQLDATVAAVRRDAPLKLAVQEMKWRFLNAAEALIHGDLHTGSVMVTERDTRVIDPEFAFYGPMGFDVGAILGNLLMAYLSQRGHESHTGERQSYQAYLVAQTHSLWETFQRSFAELWRTGAARTDAARSEADGEGGCVYQPRLILETPQLLASAIDTRLTAVWRDALGYAGCKIIRRILGLAHVEDFEAIADPELRAACELSALRLARELLVNRAQFGSMAALVEAARLGANEPCG
jgi:5-methylthioribose kinase